MLNVPVSVGEVLDKISILEIKSARIADADKLRNVRTELSHLLAIAKAHRCPALEQQLKQVNETLWDVEDRIRIKEHLQEFDDEFIELARAVYVTNDRRAEIKREINLLAGSALVEEKSYAAALGDRLVVGKNCDEQHIERRTGKNLSTDSMLEV